MITDKPSIWCNSRHWAAPAWLAETYPDVRVEYKANVRDHELSDDVCLISTYPFHMLRHVGHLINIEYTKRPYSSELSPTDMRTHGAHLVHYRLIRSSTQDGPEIHQAYVAWLRRQDQAVQAAALSDISDAISSVHPR